MPVKSEQLHNGYKVGEIFIDEEIIILDFDNTQYQLHASFMEVVAEYAEVTIDKGKYR